MSPKVKGDIGSRQRVILSTEAHQARKYFTSRKVDSQGIERYRAKQRAKQFLVKGRVGANGMLWDVYKLDGFTEPALVGSDFVWQEEAIAFARDLSLGRVAVGFGKVRGLFQRGVGGVLTTSKTIELPNDKSVKVKAVRGGVVVG